MSSCSLQLGHGPSLISSAVLLPRFFVLAVLKRSYIGGISQHIGSLFQISRYRTLRHFMVQCDNGPSYKSKVMSKTKDKRGTTRTDDERGQENQGTDTASGDPRTPEKHKRTLIQEDPCSLLPESPRTKGTDVLRCLMSAQEKEKQNLCMNAREEYENISESTENRSISGEVRVVPNREDNDIRHSVLVSSLEASRRTSSTLVTDTFESSTITVRRVVPCSRCAQDLVKT